MAALVLLLRGINVGGSKKVPMAELRTALEAAGFDGVRTYVQSGNVVLDAGGRAPDAAAAEVEQAIERAFGFAVAVTARTREQLAAVVAANPFPEAAETPKHLHVVFLAAPVADAALADLDRAAFAPDRFELRGRELYLHTPDGLGRSRLADRLVAARRLGPGATARNWRTVLTLLEMAGEEGPAEDG